MNKTAWIHSVLALFILAGLVLSGCTPAVQATPTATDVPAGQTTDYQPAPNGVYNYAAYEFEVNGETQMQPVIDWVGESPRPGQSYTYVIELDASQPAMQQIKLIEVLADLND